ncbi:MAG: hypothetical protein ACI4KD_01660 [Oscillospiraceae bacterium]
MKKILIAILAVSMLTSLTACATKDNIPAQGEEVSESTTAMTTEHKEENSAPETEETAIPAETEETTKETTAPAETTTENLTTTAPAETTVGPTETAESSPESSGTMGNTLYNDFVSKAKNNPSMSTEELANELVKNPVIKFAPMTMPVEEGYLAGFSTEIDGFKSGATFGPMIGSIPFVGYVFEVEKESDVDGFIKKLKDNADPRWNICVEADETVCGNVGTKVFFVMCPASAE